MPEANTTEHLPIQYSDASGYVTQELDDATVATVFTVDSEVIVHMVKTRQGRWRTDTSDHWQITAREERTRYPTPQELLDGLAAARGIHLTQVSYA